MDHRIIKVIPGLLAHPLRALNLARYWLHKTERNETVGYLPFVLDIEPTTFCNFKCRMCHVSDPDFVHHHMPLDLFKRIINDNPQLIKIHLQGMGEPLLCPQLFDMISYADRKRILIQTTTNGSMLNEPNVRKLINARLTSIGISIDGATAGTFESIRQCSDFGKVVEGVKRLVAEKRKARANTIIRAWTVVQKENANEAEGIVRLCKEIGFDCLVFQLFISGWGKTDWSAKNSGKQLDIACAKDQIEKAVSLGKQLDFNVRMHTGDIYSRQKPCSWPWYSAFISADGFMVPCCILGDSRIKNFGNIQEKKLSVVWNSQPYRAFRTMHMNNAIPPFCRNCYDSADTGKAPAQSSESLVP